MITGLRKRDPDIVSWLQDILRKKPGNTSTLEPEGNDLQYTFHNTRTALTLMIFIIIINYYVLLSQVRLMHMRAMVPRYTEPDSLGS